MSAFDAGTIRGSLDLDTTSYKHGFDEAHTHANTKGKHIREILESLTEVFNEALGPAVAAFAEQMRSVFAGFSEGPVIGGLNAIATAAGFVREAVGEVGLDFQQLGLEAQKAGVSVEFMDGLANVASTTNVSLEQLGMGFKILEQRAQEAKEGGKQAQEAFERVGVSSEELARLMDDPQKLWERVQASIGGMTSASLRNEAAQKLNGRAGVALIPLLSMTTEEYNRMKEALDRLSGGVNEDSANMGRSFALLQAYISAGMEGIERAVSKPILAFLAAHMSQIQPVIEGVFESISKVVGTVASFIVDHLSTIIHALEGMVVAIGLLAAASLPAIFTAIAAAATAVAGPLIALVAAMAAPVTVAIALGAAIGILNEHFPILGQDAQALGTVLKDLGLVAFHYVEIAAKAVWREMVEVATIMGGALTEAFNAVANSPVGAALETIGEIFHKIRMAIQWVIDKVNELIQQLFVLAGVEGKEFAMSTPGAKNAEAARSELGLPPRPDSEASSSSGTASNLNAAALPHAIKEIGEAAKQSAPPQSRVRAERREPTAYGDHVDALSSLNPAPFPSKKEIADAAKKSSLHKSTAHDDHVDALSSLNPAPFPSKKGISDAAKNSAQAHARPTDYNLLRGELGDAFKGDDGTYRVKSHAGGGIGGALTQDQYDNLRQSERDDRGGDSVSQWRKSHPHTNSSIAGGSGANASTDALKSCFDQLSGSIDALTNKMNGGTATGSSYSKLPYAGKAAAGTTNYNVAVTTQLDPKQTADALSKQLFPALQQLQKQHDQAAAGAMAAQAAAMSTGGGGN